MGESGRTAIVGGDEEGVAASVLERTTGTETPASDDNAVVTADPNAAEGLQDIEDQIVAGTPSFLGTTNVTTAGTAVSLFTTTVSRSVRVKGKNANTGNVYVGTSNVDDDIWMEKVPAGQAKELVIADPNLLFIDADEDGDGVYVFIIT